MTESSNAGSAISLSGAAVVFLSGGAEELQRAADMDQGVATTDSPTFAGQTINGNITGTGTVDGRDGAADGALAASAVQPGDNISTLTNDAGYTPNVGDITGVTAGSHLSGGGTSGAVTLNVVDGSGSGLDADLLDGVQGSSYLRSDTADTFTTLSGTALTIGSGVELRESADRADLLQITSTTSSWGGLQIRNSSNEGRWSFMTDGSAAGIYDDENGDWHVYMTENAGVQLRYNGATKLQTTSGGATVTGTVTATAFSGDGSGLTGISSGEDFSGYSWGSKSSMGDLTSYQNATGKTILVVIECHSGDFSTYRYSYLQVSSNGSSWSTINEFVVAGIESTHISILVPAGHYYRVDKHSSSTVYRTIFS